MSIEERPFDSLGRFDNDWLNARFHFNFGEYRNPERMGVGPLIVWNDDSFQPGRGFDMHPHEDMEIITYLRQGAITHRDNLGNEGRIETGDVQIMSAGTGIVHSEFNMESEPTLLYQIWILPHTKGVEPRWDSARFPKEERTGELVPLVSGRQGVDSDLRIHQDASLLCGVVPAGESVSLALGEDRQGYLVCVAGSVEINGVAAGPRAGTVIQGESEITIKAIETAELILADLPTGGDPAWRS